MKYLVALLLTLALFGTACGGNSDGVISADTTEAAADAETTTTTSAETTTTTEPTTTTTAPTTTTTAAPTLDDVVAVADWGGTLYEGDFPQYLGTINIRNLTDDWLHFQGLELDFLLDGAIFETDYVASEWGAGIYLAPGDNWLGFDLYDPPGAPTDVQPRVGDFEFEEPPGQFEFSDLALTPEQFGGITITGRVDSTWPEDLEFVVIRLSFFDPAGNPIGGTRAYSERLPAGGAALLEQRIFSDIDAGASIIATVVPN